ncbi:hypothetical protein [Bremerella cremea]|uniref:hypothetical protein n=1 Tax=Bremerella cremea TaxID=1031537 RepID=UPI0031F00D05
MTLDIYVMPLWRFKAGEYDSPLESWLDDSDAQTPVKPRRSFSPVQLWKRWKAKRQAKQIIAAAARQLDCDLAWSDDGEVVLAEQAAYGFVALRAYAQWLDLREAIPCFEHSPRGNYYEHPVMLREEPPPPRFQHLVEHNCHNGYLVPVAFDRVAQVEPYQVWGGYEFFHSFGSIPAISRELATLKPLLPASDDPAVADEAKQFIQDGFSTLETACQIGLEHELPIIFYG